MKKLVYVRTIDGRAAYFDPDEIVAIVELPANTDTLDPDNPREHPLRTNITVRGVVAIIQVHGSAGDVITDISSQIDSPSGKPL